MGRRGPAPKPTALKLRDGETRPSRINAEEPIPAQEPPKPPDDMTKEAKRVWRHVLKVMPTGVIVSADRDILRLYCDVVSEYSKHLAILDLPIRQNSRGDWVVHPLHRVVRDEREQIRLLARELGLTPAARANLRMDAEAGADVLAGLGPMLQVVGE